jgi:FtsP/CotA-like multicopper oxidase with cupredoxin domain
MRHSHWTIDIPILLFLAPLGGCENSVPTDAQDIENQQQAVTTTALAPLLPAASIPRFATQFQRLPTYVPTLQRDSHGRIIGQEYTVTVSKFTAQQLPPGFPATLMFGYGGQTVDLAGAQAFRRTTPGPTFEQIRNRPATIHYQNDLQGPHPLAVDPTVDWANPNNFPKPLPPFLPFPPGYPQAQAPITFTTHTHGIEVLPEFDGTPDTWFTTNGITGPEYVSNTYVQPSSNESTAFWYHDHSFGVTRLDVGAGLSGFSILRDPNNPLDKVGNARMLGFEDPYDWSSTQLALGQDTRHSEGSFAMSMEAKGYSTFKSGVFALTGSLATTITLDFLMPTTQPNPYWLGAVQLYVDCPSKNVFNAYVGQVELTGKPLNTFNQLSFPVPAAITGTIDGSCSDFDLSIAVNVPANATGTYLIDNLRGIPTTPSSPLPQGEFEVPLIVQDRSFRTDGSLFYPTDGLNPAVNPYWTLFFDGTTNVVNGKVWPNMDVKRHQYRFRILNSANQRFYRLSFSNGMPFKVIGSDGGYLRNAQSITSFRIGVTERVDILVDFEQLAPGTKVVMQNTEILQPPIGTPPDPNTDGTMMQFTVVDSAPVSPRPLPATLNTIATLTPNRPGRTLVQNVELSPAGAILQAELDGQLFHTQTTEMPAIGTTEDWTFVNTTPLDHNKHVHLIEFLLVERVPINAAQYRADWVAVNGEPPFTHPTIKLPIEPYITGPATGPQPEESGWKDTIGTPAGHATRIRIRWAPQSLPTGADIPGVNQFVIDPIYSIGYVWHCHLVEHEDNEMIRPMGVIPFWKQGKFYGIGNRSSPGIYANVVDYNGVDYLSQVPHTSLLPPPQEFNKWERVNNMDGDWAVQIVYQVGDRARFMGHIYQALVQHKATTATQPNVAPAFWQLIL